MDVDPILREDDIVQAGEHVRVRNSGATSSAQQLRPRETKVHPRRLTAQKDRILNWKLFHTATKNFSPE